jgi:membrane protease YdiL (CAAX protease family)
MQRRETTARWLELIGIFAGIPVVVGLGLVPVRFALIPLFAVAAPAALWLGKQDGFTRRTFWQTGAKAEREYLPFVVFRFAILGTLLTASVLILFPQRFLDLPREATGWWLAILVLYPALSVYPQELLFRVFFFKRYASLFPSPRLMVPASAFTFGWAHIVFGNGWAVAYTLIGGWLFADTYRRTGSVRLVCLEHTLYGNLIFTIGYGHAFLR